MDDDQFWADVEVEQDADGLWVAVLAFGRGKGESAQVVRIPVEGSYEHPEQAREAAKDAIALMALR